MVTPSAHETQAGPWRLSAQLILSRAHRRLGGTTDADTITQLRQDYATTRMAEHLEREMSRAPKLRPEQVAALRAIVAGADIPAVLADAVSARPSNVA